MARRAFAVPAGARARSWQPGSVGFFERSWMERRTSQTHGPGPLFAPGFNIAGNRRHMCCRQASVVGSLVGHAGCEVCCQWVPPEMSTVRYLTVLRAKQCCNEGQENKMKLCPGRGRTCGEHADDRLPVGLCTARPRSGQLAHAAAGVSLGQRSSPVVEEDAGESAPPNSSWSV